MRCICKTEKITKTTFLEGRKHKSVKISFLTVITIYYFLKSIVHTEVIVPFAENFLRFKDEISMLYVRMYLLLRAYLTLENLIH